MPAILALITEILANVPTLVSAGVNIASLVGKARDALTAVAAPDDAAWKALDDAVAALEADLNKDPPVAAV